MFVPGSRRDLLRSTVGHWLERVVENAERAVVRQRYVRPPGALPEVAFLAACTRCGKCAEVCPVHAIITVPTSGGLAAGTPHIDATRQPCVACTAMPCAEACPTDALTVPEHGWQGYRLAALTFVPERCLTFQGQSCGVCLPACPAGEAALTLDAGSHPVIHIEGCVGCGACVRACPTYPSSFELTPAES